VIRGVDDKTWGYYREKWAADCFWLDLPKNHFNFRFHMQFARFIAHCRFACDMRL